SLRARDSVGNWLYGVAYRTAQEAKRAAARRVAREKKAAHMFRPKRSEDASEKFLGVLYEQLNKLPDKHRVVIVLSDLEGQRRKQVAQVLGVAEGTVASRLARARRLLAQRLSRCGLTVSAGALTAVLSQQAGQASVPASVLAATVHAAALVAAGAATPGVISTQIVSMAEAVMKGMVQSKLKLIMASVFTLLVVIGGGVFSGALLFRSTPALEHVAEAGDGN